MDVGKLSVFGRDANLPIGVDVGTSSVKMVRLAKDTRGYVVLAAARADIAAAVSGEADEHAASVTDAIHRCHGRLGGNFHAVVCGLSGPLLAVRDFVLPGLPAEDVEAVVRLEAEQSCHLDINRSVMDFQVDADPDAPTPADGDALPDEIRGFFAMADQSLIQESLDRLKLVGLHAVMMDINNLALLNCLWECKPPTAEHSVCVVDIGAASTNVAIMGRQGAPCVRDLPYGSNQIIDDLVNQQGLSMDTVGPLFQPEGGGRDVTPELQRGLAASCARMMAEIGSSLRYYRATGAVAPFECIHLCGGLSLIDEVVSLIRHSLPVPVVRWDPFETIRITKEAPGEDLLKHSGAAMAVATGLAMRCP